ncbi:MAG: acylneuraminate cytidylyltransferase family protein, partial [Saprospiraceae bacterium]
MITVFLPCRKGSQRVKNKNVRRFANQNGGLVKIKLAQLLQVTEIQQIVLSTDDELVKNIGRNFASKKIIIDDRPADLASSTTSTDDLIKYVPTIIAKGDILWTHVTSPFINENDYEAIIKQYYTSLEKGYDSLMTVTPLHKFLWNEDNAINYDRAIEKWPRTQTLTPVYEVNSAVFLANATIYRKEADRIGKHPFLYATDEQKSYD